MASNSETNMIQLENDRTLSSYGLKDNVNKKKKSFSQ